MKPQDRARDIEAALDWMRNKGVKPEDDDVPMSEKLDKIESVPIFRCTPDQRMDDVNDIVTWLRNDKDDSEGPTGQFKKIDQMIPKPKRGQKPEDRAREIEGILDWMRSNEVGPDETTLSSFLTADQDGPVPRPVRIPPTPSEEGRSKAQGPRRGN